MASVSHEKLMWAFEKRWDYLSARSMFRNALKDSGLSEKKDYTEGDVGKLLAVLTKMGERQVDVITKSLFPGEAPPAVPVEEPKPAAPVEEPKPAEPAEEPKPTEPAEGAEPVEEKAEEKKEEEEGEEEKDEKESKKKSKKSKD